MIAMKNENPGKVTNEIQEWSAIYLKNKWR